MGKALSHQFGDHSSKSTQSIQPSHLFKVHGMSNRDSWRIIDISWYLVARMYFIQGYLSIFIHSTLFIESGHKCFLFHKASACVKAFESTKVDFISSYINIEKHHAITLRLVPISKYSNTNFLKYSQILIIENLIYCLSIVFLKIFNKYYFNSSIVYQENRTIDFSTWSFEK